MDDLIKSMKAHLYDRVSSPLVFSFLCSWAIWNYRLMIILLSGADPEKKFAQIEALPTKSYLIHLFPTMPPEAYWLSVGFLGPLVTTLFYLLVLPKFEAMALKISLEKSVKLKAIKLEAENATPIPHDESIHLREMIREAEEARDAAIERQRVLMQKEVDKRQKALEEAQIAINQNHQDATNQQASMQNEINALTQAKTHLEHQFKEAENIAAAVYGLEQDARGMMKSLGDGTATILKDQVHHDPKVSRAFRQLYTGGLATISSETVRLSAAGERLVLAHQLRQSATGSVDVP